VKVEAKLFGFVAIFLLIDVPVYWFLSKDTVGTTALSMAFGLCALVPRYAGVARVGARRCCAGW